MYMPSIFNNSVFDNFDNWMDFSFPSFNQRLYGASSSQLMKTDVKETDKDYEVSIDLPGFKKDELQIELKDGYLTVSGSKEVTSKDMPEENQKDATTAREPVDTSARRSRTRASTPRRASSAASSIPTGPAPTIRTVMPVATRPAPGTAPTSPRSIRPAFARSVRADGSCGGSSAGHRRVEMSPARRG